MQPHSTGRTSGTRPTPEQIAALAYQLHVSGGSQSSLDDWLCAEYLLSTAPAQDAEERSTPVPMARAAEPSRRVTARQVSPSRITLSLPSAPDSAMARVTRETPRQAVRSAAGSPQSEYLDRGAGMAAMVQLQRSESEAHSYRWSGINE